MILSFFEFVYFVLLNYPAVIVFHTLFTSAATMIILQKPHPVAHAAFRGCSDIQHWV